MGYQSPPCILMRLLSGDGALLSSSANQFQVKVGHSQQVIGEVMRITNVTLHGPRNAKCAIRFYYGAGELLTLKCLSLANGEVSY